MVDFLQYQQRADTIQEIFEDYFENNSEHKSIQDGLEDLLESISYSFDEREEFEVIDVQMNDASYDFNYAEVESDGSAKAFLTAYFYVKIKSRYLDISNSYYDKEDDEYIVKSYIESEEIHRFEQEIILDFVYEVIEESKDEKYELEFNGVNNDIYDMSIDLSENDTLFECIDTRSIMTEKISNGLRIMLLDVVNVEKS